MVISSAENDELAACRAEVIVTQELVTVNSALQRLKLQSLSLLHPQLQSQSQSMSLSPMVSC